MTDSYFQLNRYEAKPPKDASELQIQGFWPTEIPLPADPYRDEYATGHDRFRIIRVAGITARPARAIEPSELQLLPARRVEIVPEPRNRFDSHALRVDAIEAEAEYGRETIGFVPRSMNVGLAKWLNEQEKTQAWVLCQWADTRTVVLWDGLFCGGDGHLARSMHLLLARPEVVGQIDPCFEPEWGPLPLGPLRP